MTNEEGAKKIRKQKNQIHAYVEKMNRRTRVARPLQTSTLARIKLNFLINPITK